jgi:hypothetical protein
MHMEDLLVLWEANIDLHNLYWIHILQQVIVHLI